MRPAKATVLALAVFLTACRMLPTQPPSPSTPSRTPEVLLRGLAFETDTRRVLQATLKLAVDGPDGSFRSTSFVVAERPSNLYVEVKGALRQVIAVLVTDGVYYELTRNGGTPAERGIVHTQLLYEVARIPLQPEEAVAILLGTPLLPKDFQVSSVHDRQGEGRGDDEEGRSELLLKSSRGRGHDVLCFDAQGRLVEFRIVDEDEQALMEVRYEDFQAIDGRVVAHRIRLEFPLTSTKVEISLRDVVLDPSLPAGLFNLDTHGASNSDSGVW